MWNRPCIYACRNSDDDGTLIYNVWARCPVSRPPKESIDECYTDTYTIYTDIHVHTRGEDKGWGEIGADIQL